MEDIDKKEAAKIEEAEALDQKAKVAKAKAEVATDEQLITDEEAKREAARDEEVSKPSELDMLKERAKLMGISFSNNIGIDSLKERIKEHTSEKEEKDKEAEASKPKVNKSSKAVNLRMHLRKNAMKLVRLRITNLDPKKKDHPGEIFTFANEYLGTVRKYVPYGEVTDNGYHVENCIYKQLDARKFLSIRTRRGKRGEEIVEHNWAKEFALEVLPQLTTAELAKLSTAQQAAGGLGD